MSKQRTGTTPHQHAIILHQIAEHIRYTTDVTDRSKSELIEIVDSMRGWMARNALRLLDDSRELHMLREAARQQHGRADGGEGA